MLLRLSCVITISRNVIFTHHVAKYFVTILYTSSIKLCVTHSFLSNDRVSVLIAVFVFYVYFVVGYEIGVLFCCKTNLIARGGFLTLLFLLWCEFQYCHIFSCCKTKFFRKNVRNNIFGHKRVLFYSIMWLWIRIFLPRHSPIPTPKRSVVRLAGMY